MTNRYLVAFAIYRTALEPAPSFGNEEIETEGIQSMDDIEAMQRELKKKYNAASIVILSWKKFEKV